MRLLDKSFESIERRYQDRVQRADGETLIARRQRDYTLEHWIIGPVLQITLIMLVMSGLLFAALRGAHLIVVFLYFSITVLFGSIWNVSYNRWRARKQAE